jgi:hypothetical protein
MGSQGGEQVQILLVAPLEQAMDGRPDRQKRRADQPYMPIVPYSPVLHMLALCPYSKLVWQELSNWMETTLQPSPRNYRKFKSWWSTMVVPRGQVTQDRTQRIIYTAWNIWKEHMSKRQQGDVNTSSRTMLSNTGLLGEQLPDLYIAVLYSIEQFPFLLLLSSAVHKTLIFLMKWRNTHPCMFKKKEERSGYFPFVIDFCYVI